MPFARPLAPDRAVSLALLLILAGGTGLLVRTMSREGRRPGPAWTRPARTAMANTAPPLARIIADDAPLPVPLAPAPDAPITEPSASKTHPATRTRIVAGPMEQVLYGGARSEVDPRIVAQALSLFAHKLDLTRDLALGDRIRLAVRPGRDGGAPVLDYAEWRGTGGGEARLYRRDGTDGFSAGAFTDATGEALDRQLLRTPLASARITSGFGFRLHPLLGYSRMHEGVDFAAAVGTPVLAAGNGRVRAARWAGGYGRLVQLDHGHGFETRYAHLSAWAPWLAPGVPVRQGQVIGWAGASGLATGPHLHFEVRQDGRPIDPRLAALPTPAEGPARLAAFQARKRAIDALLDDPSSSL